MPWSLKPGLIAPAPVPVCCAASSKGLRLRSLLEDVIYPTSEKTGSSSPTRECRVQRLREPYWYNSRQLTSSMLSLNAGSELSVGTAPALGVPPMSRRPVELACIYEKPRVYDR